MTNMEPLDALFDDGPPAEAPIAPQPPDGALRDLAARLPRTMRLGTSTWNFPGWRGIIWSRGSGLTGLAENGLTAYSKNPLLRTVGLDRNFYRALTTAHFAHYAAQVPEDFRFIVKAPREVTDPYERDDRGRPTGTNPLFLNAHAAVDKFLGPARLGLGAQGRTARLSIFPGAASGIADAGSSNQTFRAYYDFSRRTARAWRWTAFGR